MSVVPQSAPRTLQRRDAAGSSETVRMLLLACGVVYALLYVVANDLIAAALYDGYSRSSQAVSELSATGAPSRPFLVGFAPFANALLIAFGLGVWRSARGKRTLRVAGALLVAQGITAFLWLVAPMSPREQIAAQGGTVEDTLHLALSAASVVFIVAQIGFGAVALGREFRVFSLVAIAAFLVTGAVMGMQSARLPAGEPTPWLGLIERGMLGAWLVWMAVLALVLVRRAYRPAWPRGRERTV